VFLAVETKVSVFLAEGGNVLRPHTAVELGNMTIPVGTLALPTTYFR
jgi:hypothetical protein